MTDLASFESFSLFNWLVPGGPGSRSTYIVGLAAISAANDLIKNWRCLLQNLKDVLQMN